MNQYSFWHREHQVLVTPIQPTLRDPDVYSLNIWVFAPNRDAILTEYINTDEVFWKGFDNRDNIVHYYTRWIDNNGDWTSFDDELVWEDL